LAVFRRFKFGTPEDHPDLGQSILAGDPLPDFKKWKFLGSVHGNPDIQQLQAVYHDDKPDNGVEPYIIGEGSGLIKGRRWKNVAEGIDLKNQVRQADGQ